MIHVFIEKARNIKCGDGGTVDPMVEVSVMNEKKYTSAKDDVGPTGVANWNEHLFFEPKNCVNILSYPSNLFYFTGSRRD